MSSPSNKNVLSLLSIALLPWPSVHPLAAAQNTETTTSAQKDYLLIGAGDLVSVTVFREPDLAAKSRVDAARQHQPPVDRRHPCGRPYAAAGAEGGSKRTMRRRTT